MKNKEEKKRIEAMQVWWANCWVELWNSAVPDWNRIPKTVKKTRHD